MLPEDLPGCGVETQAGVAARIDQAGFAVHGAGNGTGPITPADVR